MDIDAVTTIRAPGDDVVATIEATGDVVAFLRAPGDVVTTIRAAIDVVSMTQRQIRQQGHLSL